jgi:hypothetical protein
MWRTLNHCDVVGRCVAGQGQHGRSVPSTSPACRRIEIRPRQSGPFSDYLGRAAGVFAWRPRSGLRLRQPRGENALRGNLSPLHRAAVRSVSRPVPRENLPPPGTSVRDKVNEEGKPVCD